MASGSYVIYGGFNMYSRSKLKKISIGIDQSYKDTGICISYLYDNGKKKIKEVISVKEQKNKTEYRKLLKDELIILIHSYLKIINYQENKGNKVELHVCLERIRQFSKGFININYIKSIGALNATIVDTFYTYNIPVYSVDTRHWKAKIIGTSKPQKNNKNISPEKYPTINFLIKNGYFDLIKEEAKSKRKYHIYSKKEQKLYLINDNKADAICISLYGLLDKKEQNIKLET